MKRRFDRFWIYELALLSLLLIVIFDFNAVASLLEPMIGTEKDAVEWAPLYELAYQYLFVVFIFSNLSFLIAFFLGFFLSSFLFFFSLGSFLILFKLEGFRDLFLTI